LIRSFVAVNDKSAGHDRWRKCSPQRKKTAEAIQQEVAGEVSHVLRAVFAAWHKTGRIALEAIETLIREPMHAAGAVVI